MMAEAEVERGLAAAEREQVVEVKGAVAAGMELAEEGKAQEAAVMGPVGAEMGAAAEETGMIRRR